MQITDNPNLKHGKCCVYRNLPRANTNPQIRPSTLYHRSSLLYQFTALYGWLDNFLPAPIENTDDSQRRTEYPEQYPATYELNDTVTLLSIKKSVNN